MKDNIVIKGNKRTVDRFLYSIWSYHHLSEIEPFDIAVPSEIDFKSGFAGYYRGTEITVEYTDPDIDN